MNGLKRQNGNANVLIRFKLSFCETVKGKADLVYEVDGTIIEKKALASSCYYSN